MLQLSENVWLALSPDNDSVAGEVYDCNGYLVWDGETGVLIDAGAGKTAQHWLDEVSRIAPLEKLAGVFLTHYHLDHAGGAAAAAAAGLKLFGSAETARALAAADEKITQVAAARQAGVYPPDYMLPGCPDIKQVGSGDEIGPLRVLQTPGHCDGHLVGLTKVKGETALFSGDMLFACGKISVQAIPDCRLHLYAESIFQVERENVSALYPGHGPAVLDPAEAHSDITSAAQSFRRLVPPPNWVS